MTCTRTCHQGKQPCPSPWACSVGCKAGVTEFRRESPRDRAAEAFWNELPVKFVGPEPDEAVRPDEGDMAIAWVQRWAKHIGVFCGSVALTLLILGATL